MRFRKGSSIAAAAALITLLSPASVLAPASAGPAAAPCGGMETIQLRTFYLDIKLSKKVYEVGENAIFNITITRPAHEDPMGQGQPVDPPMSEPAPDVSVGIGLVVDDVYLWGLGISDQAGKARVKVKLKSYTPAGMAQARAFAKKNVAETPCFIIDEIGVKAMPNAFRVVR